MSKKNCDQCSQPLMPRVYRCDTCGKWLCGKCSKTLSIACIGNMNVGRVCVECVKTMKDVTVVDPDNPRYFNK